MGGIQLDVKDDLSQELVNAITATLSSDQAVLEPNSDYLKHVRSNVEQSTIPLLSIGSRCQISNQCNNLLRIISFLRSTDGLRQNLTDTDIILKLSSQLAVKDWASRGQTISVKLYEGYAHQKDISLIIGNPTDAPSILQNQEMQKLVVRFVGNPDRVVQELNGQ